MERRFLLLVTKRLKVSEMEHQLRSFKLLANVF
jgi:hypothetical protein